MEQAFRLQALSALAGRYDVVYADPPWPMWGSSQKDAAAGKHYDLMSLPEILGLPVRSLFRGKNGALFLWCTCPRADLAFQAISAWGLHFRGIPFIWTKSRQDGGLIHGQGVPPTCTKPTSELCLLATVKPKGRPFPLLNSAMGQVVVAPRGRHSEKPAEIRDRIVTLYGDRPRIELFARERVVGWDAWGLEAPNARAEGEVHAQADSGAKSRDNGASSENFGLLDLAHG